MKPEIKIARKVIELLPDESWYGGIVRHGLAQPYGHGAAAANLIGNLDGNQGCPFLVSSKGRYVWCKEPFAFEFTKETLIIKDAYDAVILGEGYNDLRRAYLEACKKHFPASGKTPDMFNFTTPQYNSWIELQFNPSQEKVLQYARKVLACGLEPGIMMIDNYWYKWNGNWTFDKEAFPDPKGMIDELHAQGFKVILWISPFISADSRTFMTLKKRNLLIKDEKGEPAIQSWWDGYSCCIDLTHPEGFKWLQDSLDHLVEKYKVDGFKFDGGDPYRYLLTDQTYKLETPNTHCELFAKIGLKYDTSEYRACWKLGGQHLLQRIRDKEHSFDKGGLADIIPSVLIQGLIGYPYTCPDMIGGGEVNSFLEDNSDFSEELYVRWMQCSVFFPMIQFSILPNNVLNSDNLRLVMDLVQLRQQTILPLLKELLKNAAETGEPVIRHMAYEFPGESLEKVMHQYMFGSDYLVAPVLEKGATTRSVIFPNGNWLADDGTIYAGGQKHTIEAPLIRLPYFKKM